MNTLDKSARMGLIPQAFVNMAICYDLFSHRLERSMRPLGLNMTSVSLLNHFSWDPKRSWTVSELVQVMGIHQPGITKAVKSMLDKGFLTRQVDEHDARVKHLFVSDLGMKTLAQVRELTFPILAEAYAAVPDSQLEALAAALGVLKSGLESTRP
ncbi:MAG: DNA-binding MarR family transcriptional regulator [Flavobacteriales bacterium]|jgi:DNA-binding MarR family transcriptional regulator